MGESAKAEISVCSPELESFSVETPGGRIQGLKFPLRATSTNRSLSATIRRYLRTSAPSFIEE